MTAARRLAIFDVDGTLVDSQARITASMAAAFEASGRPVPPRAEILAVVGLSLPDAIQRLAGPDAHQDVARMVAAYKNAYDGATDAAARASAPLYDGAAPLLKRLSERGGLLLGVATGKSRRGLAHVFALHDIAHYFVTAQVADDHPSKPHPSMIHAALSETGCAAAEAVMIGDTVYDIEMGRAAGLRTIAVTWGYHPEAALRAAEPARVVHDFGALGETLDEILGLAHE